MSWLTNSCNIFKTAFQCASNFQQTRNTFVLRRKFKAPLHKIGSRFRRLTHKYFIYDLVEDTNIRPVKPIKVILTQDVNGFGEKGDFLEVKPERGYKHLILPGFGVYGTPENIKKYNVVPIPKEKATFLSRLMTVTTSAFSREIFHISMSRTEPWILEPWHLRVTFRKASLEVSEDAIELPSEEIRGPDLSIENKLFYVTVKVSEKEKVKVLCHIQHWPIYDEDLLPKNEALFLEQTEIIAELLKNRPIKEKKLVY